MYWTEFLTVALIHLLAVASPGPDFAVVVRESVTHGRRAGMFTAFGVGTAIFVHVGYSLLGIGIIVSQSIVLFISALGMAQGKPAVQADNVQQDVTIVPLTIPLTVGPGTIGALLVMGVSQPHWDDKLTAIISITLASFTVGVVLYLSNRIERILGDQGLQIVSRLMGLFVCALAAQIIFTGIKGYLVP